MTLREQLSRLLSPPLAKFDATPAPGLIAIDLGCGRLKRPGTVGFDLEPLEGVDHVVDFRHEPLPVGDGTVGSVFSSHSIEHIEDPEHLFREITRVCASGAPIELWTPYAWHNTAVFPDHKTQWTHEFYLHVGFERWRHWTERLGGRWHIDEFVYVIEQATQRRLVRQGFTPQFAVDHLQNVVAEFGVRGWIDKSGSTEPPTAPRRCYAATRADSLALRYPLDGGPMAPLHHQVRLLAARTLARRRDR